FNVTAPSANQRALLPALLSHTDIFLKDVTGSGKTLGLVAAMLSKSHPLPIDTRRTPKRHDPEELLRPRTDTLAKLGDPSAYLTTLVVVPTRDLAVQITTWLLDLAPHVPHAQRSSLVQCVVSGVPIEEQIALLKSTVPRILVGTPAILAELRERKAYDTSNLQLLVLDEVDRMVSISAHGRTVKKQIMQIHHPLSAEVLVQSIVDERRASWKIEMKKINERSRLKVAVKENPNLLVSKTYFRIDPVKRMRLQVVACSATSNHALRKEVTVKRQWVVRPTFIDMSGFIRAPKTITHRVMIAGEERKALQATPNPHHIPANARGSIQSGLRRTSRVGSIRARTRLATTSSTRTDSTASRRLAAASSSPTAFATSKFPQPPLDPSSPALIQTIVTCVRKEDIHSAFLFLNSRMSVPAMVKRLSEAGITARSLPDLIDHHALTIGAPVAVASTVADTAIAGRAAPASTPSPRAAPFFSTFHTGETQIVVVTEHEARGLDLPSATHAFIVGLPADSATYLQMAGRAGRFGRPGIVTTVVRSERDRQRMLELFKMLRIDSVDRALSVTEPASLRHANGGR
ncbi:P-loop containing nucleoside triphosphate hydrolase protein, partial [Blyttiomyces helicus]